MLTQIKENPIKSAISVFTLLSMLIGGVFTIDGRYAKADDLNKQQQIIEKTANDTKYAIDNLRKQSIDDKIFEIELIPEDKRSQSDKARLEKYKRESQDIDRKWSDRNIPK